MDELTISFEPDQDQRKYVLVAIKGVGVCPLPVTGLCKSQDHTHWAATRIGYKAASEWVLRRRNDGYHVTSMDRVY